MSCVYVTLASLDARLGPAPRRTLQTLGAVLGRPGIGIPACDFLHVDTVLPQRVYVLFMKPDLGQDSGVTDGAAR